MYDTGRDILDALKAAPDTFRFLLRNVTQEQAMAAKGGDEGWSVVEVMCHLRDAEERSVERVHLMRTENNPSIVSFDQDEWARDRNYAAQDLREALEAYNRFRGQHIEELSALSPQDWERPGLHEEQGDITIANYAMHIVAHDSQHAAQLARQLGAGTN